MFNAIVFIIIVTVLGAAATGLMFAVWRVLCWIFGDQALDTILALLGFFVIGCICLRLILG